MSEILPAIFFGHGNPMNALMNNSYTEGWRAVGRVFRHPRQFVNFSALVHSRNRGDDLYRSHRRPFTILMAFRQSYIGFSILLREILSWRGGFRSCSRDAACLLYLDRRLRLQL